MNLEFDFAPLEGLTGYLYRRIHRRHYPGVRRYFTPFLAVTEGRPLYTRDAREVLPEHTDGVPTVPQVLCSRGGDLAWACRLLADLGYEEVNLNLGCPSATVVSRGRGAGMLRDPEALDRLLEIAFSALPSGMRLSVKTRLGLAQAEEFDRLLPVFNRYPLSGLILHPRVREDYYKGTPDRAAFLRALPKSLAEMTYNGDLFCRADIEGLQREAPGLKSAMLGRGLLADPGMLCPALSDRRTTLRAFHDELLEGYCGMLSGEANVFYRMKELWAYLGFSFEGAKKPLKRMMKARRLSDYRASVDELFETCPLCETPRFIPW